VTKIVGDRSSWFVWIVPVGIKAEAEAATVAKRPNLKCMMAVGLFVVDEFSGEKRIASVVLHKANGELMNEWRRSALFKRIQVMGFECVGIDGR
jgi:hypothetical protein